MSSIPRDREKKWGCLGLPLTIPTLGRQRHADPGASWPASLAYITSSNQEDLHLEKTSKVDGRTAAEVALWSPDLCAHTITHMCISTRRHR